MQKILVADDDAPARNLIRRLLEGAGFSVTEALDGVEALELLRKERFDLMLLDLWMPRRDGLELLSRLRSEPASPKVVVITGDDAPETLLEAVREQAYWYVTKPFDTEALVELVHKVLAEEPVSSSIEVISSRPNWVELRVPCELAVVDRIENFMTQLEADLDEGVRESVGIAFRELLLNAIEWGGHLDSSYTVRISYLRARRMVLYRITDPGTGFCFEDLTHAAVGHPPDQPTAHVNVREEKGLRPGGFGIRMVQGLVDELLYNEACNEVVFVKYLD
jgi:CheY-like chemotaxis protein/anti-sigma regulatory factor (Ser/Thr protein kinase)